MLKSACFERENSLEEHVISIIYMVGMQLKPFCIGSVLLNTGCSVKEKTFPRHFQNVRISLGTGLEEYQYTYSSPFWTQKVWKNGILSLFYMVWMKWKPELVCDKMSSRMPVLKQNNVLQWNVSMWNMLGMHWDPLWDRLTQPVW